ncbi:hypothetical protein JB92DRAFT_3142460 [Gautieria morchelliformis]|nr:hypothetical protein JB92DRAFT_3142460 [Gautieria morchelliformis]
MDASGLIEESAFSFSVLNGSNTNCLSSTGSAGGAGTVLSAAKSGTNTGAIAGGTVGGVIALVCAGIAAFFLCTARRRARAKRFIERRKHWSGANSVDSKVPLSRASLQGEGIDHLDPQGVSVLRTIGRAHVNSSSSLVGEKVLSDPTGRGHELPELTRQGSWSSTNVFETDSTGHGLPRPLELVHLPGRPSAPASPRTSVELHDPFAPTPTATNRRASRTPRKPVPAYEPTAEELEALTIERTRSDRSHSRNSVNPSPSSYRPSVYPHQHSSSISTEASVHGEALLHGLKSKSSGHFEDQPMHYLIPDMPSAPPEN